MCSFKRNIFRLDIALYFPVVLFIILRNLVPAFESVEEIVWTKAVAALTCVAVYYVIQSSSKSG